MRRTYADASGGSLPGAACRGLARPGAAEDGIALILSVLVMGILTIATAATITLVMSNEHAYDRDRQANRALNVAEAGLNAGVATVKALAATATSAPNASGTTDHGSWSYTITRTQDASNSDLYYWTITSTSVSPDSNVTRIVSTQVSETVTHHTVSTTTTTPASAAYDYGFFLGDPASDCTTSSGSPNSFSGNYTISASFYVSGSLCIMQQNTNVREPDSAHPRTLNIYIGNKFKVGGNNSSPIGTSTAPIALATVVQGCLDKNSKAVVCSKQGDPTKNSNQSGYGSGIYAAGYSSTQISIPMPTIDTNWYTNAMPGPVHGCNNNPANTAQVSTYPSGYTAATFNAALFDNNSTRDTSLGTIDPLSKFGTSSWDCRYYDSDGNLKGELQWTYGNPGTLYINGTTWIDANLSMTGSYAIIHGRGTIYANGTVSFSGQTKWCELPKSGDNCLGNYDPTQNLLVLTANNAAGANPGFSMTGNSVTTFEGVAFVNGRMNQTGQASLYGPVLASSANMAGNGNTFTKVNPPPGAPGAESTTTSTTSGPDTAEWNNVPGSWKQLR